MKKILSLIALAMTIGLTACSDDDCDHNGGNPLSPVKIYGSWYEEARNEEFDVNEDGTFYDKYCNVERGGETEGRCMYDSKNKKLTETYSFMGQTQFVDWKVTNLTDFGLSIYSEDHGQHIYERIVETYQLKVGETAKIKFAEVYTDFSVLSYSSSNERLASVTPEGIIKAEGEKGTQYIKVTTNKCNVWVKVVVGDNCADLWYDYVSLIGQDYTGMRKFLNILGEPDSGDDGYSFVFYNSEHDYVDYTTVLLCPEDGMVTNILLQLNESVPEAEVLSYMNSHYYKIDEDESFVIYSSGDDLVLSKAIVMYSKSRKFVYFYETWHYFEGHVQDLWPDFVPLFGKDKNQVKSAMEEYEYSYSASDLSYSKDGADFYSVQENDYVENIAFVFNPDKQMSEYWVYLHKQSDLNTVFDYMCYYYNINNEESDVLKYVFYNKDNSVKIILDRINHVVVFTKITMKQHETPEMLGNYYEGLGMTRDQIVSQFGTPFSEDGEEIWYYVGNEDVRFAIFCINTETNKCKRVIITINESVTNTTIIDFLNSKYTVFPNLTAEDGSQYAWTNGPSIEESTLGVIYFPDSRMIYYEPLGSAANAKTRSMSSYSIKIDNNLVNQVKSKTSSILGNAKKSSNNLKSRNY